MPRPVTLHYQTRRGEKRVTITPAWAGKGIAIHKPILFDEDGEPQFDDAIGLWRLSHIGTGMAIGSCMGSLDRAKGFAREWDAEFAALQPGDATAPLLSTMAPDRVEALKAALDEMKAEPPRKPRQPAIRRGREVA